MKRLFVVAIVLMALAAMTASVAFGVDVHRVKSGLNYINPALIQDGYPVFKSGYAGGSIVAIDMYGNLVHVWDASNAPIDMATYTWPQVWEDGSVIVSMSDASGQMSGATTVSIAKGVGADADSICDIDWNSNVNWYGADYFYREDYAPHHDWKKMWNVTLGEYTYLSLITKAYTRDDAIAQGADPVYDVATGGYANGWSPDGMVEVNQAGETVWSWTFADHLVQNYDATKTADFTNGYGYAAAGSTYGEPVDYPGKIDLNHEIDHGGGPQKDWTHCNSIDFNPTLGHIVTNAKNMSEIYVVDHDATFVSGTDWAANIDAAKSDAGDFIYRFGNPRNYGQGEMGGYLDSGHHQFFGAHNIQWIGATASGAYSGFDVFGEIPGEGNMLIFDNGCWNPTTTASVVLEWNPFLTYDEATEEVVNTGDYVNPPEAGYKGASGGMGGPTFNYSNQVTWSYMKGTAFYSFYISGQQRMPNGNTIVDSGAQSHFFEVTADGTLAWEYYKPEYSVGGGFSPASSGEFVDMAGFFPGPATFRCQKIPAGHPALDGKTMTPMGNFRQLVIESGNNGAETQLKKFLGTL